MATYCHGILQATLQLHTALLSKIVAAMMVKVTRGFIQIIAEITESVVTEFAEACEKALDASAVPIPSGTSDRARLS